jgi:hypothetical protein
MTIKLNVGLQDLFLTRRNKCLPHQAAIELAERRVRKAMSYRRSLHE